MYEFDLKQYPNAFVYQIKGEVLGDKTLDPIFLALLERSRAE